MIDRDYLDGCVEVEEMCNGGILSPLDRAHVYARNIDPTYYVQIINTKGLPATEVEIDAFTVQYHSLSKISKSDYEMIVVDDNIVIFVLYKKIDARITLLAKADKEWIISFNIPNASFSV